MLTIEQSVSGQAVVETHRLFEEYAASLGVDLCFQDFARELETLPGDYAPPAGRLLLARDDGEIAGCIALRPIDGQICEMKRLYVRPAFRGSGLGRLLVDRIISEARQAGYRQMRLDSLPSNGPGHHSLPAAGVPRHPVVRAQSGRRSGFPRAVIGPGAQ